MVKRIVNADDVIGSGVASYVHDSAWWSQASGQPQDSVRIFWKGPPSSDFDRVEITFPSAPSALNFEHHMANYGVRVISAE
jgi:hypothetical protein